MQSLALIVVLTPLLGSIISGIGGNFISRQSAHRITIFFVTISFLVSLIIGYQVIFQGQFFNGSVYTWVQSGSFQFDMGFLIDSFSAIMMIIVNFVSMLVHIYSVGYMKDDPGYKRFFSYMSLFTFAMLLLVTANNFMQLFFGWEGVGLVSYLLIGFWFETEPAASGSLKAFIINRIGDMGFLLGMAAIFDFTGSLDYSAVFAEAGNMASATITIFPGHPWSLITVTCILLFIGAMGKSAQVPLHVWLPESMAGPTPISALIHAATMVTAGIYMVARMSPLFELSAPTLSLILIIGATGGLFLGLIAFVENDIKRVIAYSTLSQLGYMMAANGASAFQAAIFHLLNHACFKALLFLAAGSVIVAMHHEQDLRKMGNLRRYMPVTYVTFLIGALALSAIPPFSGFYSKDVIIEAVHQSTIAGSQYAYICLLIGVFVTSYYIFRAFFLAFHGKEHISPEVREHLTESSWSILLPLIILAIPSVFLGMLLQHSILYKTPGLLGNTVFILPNYDVLKIIGASYHGAFHEIIYGITHLIFWISISGILTAWLTCVRFPEWRNYIARYFSLLYKLLEVKYGFDLFNDYLIVPTVKICSDFFYKKTDLRLIDSLLVDGSGRVISAVSQWLRRLQSGYIYHYVFMMIIGLLGFFIWRLIF